MKERAGVFLATAGLTGTLFAGYHYDIQPFGDRSPWGVEEPVIQVDQTQPLPDNIESVIGSAVEVTTFSDRTQYRNEQGKNISTMDRIWKGSGALIASGEDKVIVTAAHVVGRAAKECAHTKVAYSRRTPGTFVGSTEAQTPVDDPSNGEEYGYNGGIDLAALVPKRQTNLQHKDSLEVQEKVNVEPGDPVFSIGFGPREAYGVDPAPDSETASMRHPQIVGGYALRSYDNRLVFMSGVASYGPKPDTRVRHGDSGGPVISKDGKYLGEVILYEKRDLSGAEVESRFDVDLPEAAENRNFQISTLQLVDAAQLKEITSSAEHCIPQERQVVTVPQGTDIEKHYGKLVENK